MKIGNDGKPAPTHASPVQAALPGGVPGNRLHIACAALAGLLLLAVSACSMFSPNTPTRSEILHVGNELMASIDAVRVKVESNEDVRQVEVTLFTDSDAQGGVLEKRDTFGFKVHDFAGDAQGAAVTQSIQAQLASLKASYEENLKVINKTIDALEEKCTVADREALTQFRALKSFRQYCYTFADHALNPAQEPKLTGYMTNYVINRHNVKAAYIIFVKSLKSWNAKESSPARNDWIRELRIAMDRLELYEQQGI